MIHAQILQSVHDSGVQSSHCIDRALAVHRACKPSSRLQSSEPPVQKQVRLIRQGVTWGSSRASALQKLRVVAWDGVCL